MRIYTYGLTRIRYLLAVTAYLSSIYWLFPNLFIHAYHSLHLLPLPRRLLPHAYSLLPCPVLVWFARGTFLALRDCVYPHVARGRLRTFLVLPYGSLPFTRTHFCLCGYSPYVRDCSTLPVYVVPHVLRCLRLRLVCAPDTFFTLGYTNATLRHRTHTFTPYYNPDTYLTTAVLVHSRLFTPFTRHVVI